MKNYRYIILCDLIYMNFERHRFIYSAKVLDLKDLNLKGILIQLLKTNNYFLTIFRAKLILLRNIYSKPIKLH